MSISTLCAMQQLNTSTMLLGPGTDFCLLALCIKYPLLHGINYYKAFSNEVLKRSTHYSTVKLRPRILDSVAEPLTKRFLEDYKHLLKSDFYYKGLIVVTIAGQISTSLLAMSPHVYLVPIATQSLDSIQHIKLLLQSPSHPLPQPGAN